ncbi:1996_t:CDS:2 [Entrophospora sp. SA101]|nr:1996_t:CDS:2 [Entrophospora sp. SA101]
MFDTVAEYLEKNQTGSDDYKLEINLDNSDDEEESADEEEEDDQGDQDEHEKKEMEKLVKIFAAAGLGGKETKWSEFPKFGGGEDDPYEWLDQYEAACEVNGVKSNRMLDLLSASLEGPALSWWRSARKTIITWEAWKSEYKRKRSFKYQFLTKFCGPERQQRWMEELRNCKQRPGETVSEYYSKLQTLYRKADPAKQYPERDNYQQFLKGLRSELRTAVRLTAASNLREAVERAKAAEAAYSMDGSLAGYSLVKKHDEELHKELKELKELLTKSAQETCDLCYKKGHQAAECPQRSLKISTQQKKNCKTCGKTGHWTKECTKTRTCYSCGQLGHFANQCPHTAQFKQILQRNDQQQPPKKVFIAQQNQLDPEDQEQNYIGEKGKRIFAETSRR